MNPGATRSPFDEIATMHVERRDGEAPEPETGASDIERLIRRMSVACDGESRLAAEIQSLDRHHDHVITVRFDISSLGERKGCR